MNCVAAQDLIKGLLRLNPEERLSIPEILEHPWLAPPPSSFCDDSEDEYYVVRNEETSHTLSNSQPSINTLDIENLFFPSKPHIKLKYQDYCYVANDFYTHNIGICSAYDQSIDEDAVKAVESFGYPRQSILNAINHGELNHATAAYNLLILN